MASLLENRLVSSSYTSMPTDVAAGSASAVMQEIVVCLFAVIFLLSKFVKVVYFPDYQLTDSN